VLFFELVLLILIYDGVLSWLWFGKGDWRDGVSSASWERYLLSSGRFTHELGLIIAMKFLDAIFQA